MQAQLKMRPSDLKPVVLFMNLGGPQSVKAVQVATKSLKELLQMKLGKSFTVLLRLPKVESMTRF